MLLVWLVCAILLAAYFVIGYACMVRRFRGTRLAPQPSIDALLDRFRFSRDPRICVSSSRRAPLTFGVFRPTVLLPEDLPVGDAQFQLILAHELAHIRRKDCLRKLLLTVCLFPVVPALYLNSAEISRVGQKLRRSKQRIGISDTRGTS